MTAYATLWTDKKHEGVVRADTLDSFLEDVFHHFAAKACRKRYAEERADPEWIDVGGEA